MTDRSSLVISEIGCGNLRYYDPTRQIVRRAQAILRFQIGQLRQKTSPNVKSAEPTWPTRQVFTGLDSTYKNSTLRVEVWDYDPAQPSKSKPLGFVELSLANLQDGVPYPFSGKFFHTEGCFPPPDRLPPMELAMVVQWSIDGTDAAPCSLSETSKASYLDMRTLFPNVKKQSIVNALVRNNYNIERATDEILNSLQTLATSTPQGQMMKTNSESMLKSFALDSGKCFTSMRNSLLAPSVHPGTKLFDHQRPGLSQPNGPVNQPGDDGRGMIDGSKRQGRRKALMIGINYYGTKKELNGCHDDVERMRQLITKLYGFASCPSLMTVLSDESPDSRLWPTRSNILLACQWLVHDVQPGDVLYFHFSGHGSQQQDLHGTETDGFDESIMPVDYKTKGHIVDDELFDALVKPLPSGVKLVALMDCCHSGTGLDLPFLWDIALQKWQQESCPKYAEGDVLLLAGCQDEQTSADVHIPKWGSGGAMTMSLVTTLTQDPYGTSVKSLIEKVRSSMHNRGLGQVPQLSVTQKFSGDRLFDFNTIKLNSNALVGQDMTNSSNVTQKLGRTYIPRPLKGTAKVKARDVHN